MELCSGTTVKGSWNNNTYRVMEKIGSGSFGQVFLVSSGTGKKMALKLSVHVTSITREYRILHRLNQNRQLKKLQAIPIVIDTDDCTVADNLYRFIVLEYMEGQVLSRFLGKRQLLTEQELWKIGVSLSGILSCLHEQNLVLGDLKPANLIYQPDGSIKVVDLGGVTGNGEIVEEYTPLFDRAAWGMGSRVADPGYDIFACCILLVLLGSGNLWLQPAEEREGLIKELAKLSWTSRFKKTVWAGLTGKYRLVRQFITDLNKSSKNFLITGRKHYPH